MINVDEYILTYGIAETWQLKPVNAVNGDDVDVLAEPLNTQSWLLDAIARANAFVGLFIDSVNAPLVFKQYALFIARYYLHFNNPSDTMTAQYELTLKELNQLKDKFFNVSAANDIECGQGFKIISPKNKYR